ncbi:sialidase family protein [Candidatus Chloroploca sp. Khr17]|uniref:sialidase family protein n=1 Tax=Candidatus Chloroploca sp. Khr17 TaxID=2496869 RepID=UPI00101D2118|nr:sialidase family protein [Candidatus Chloroploca sp. Khr17]
MKALFSTLYVLILLAVMVSPVAAQRSAWSTPLELSPPRPAEDEPNARRYGSSWFPDIAVSPPGTVHVTWYSGIGLTEREGGSLDLLMYRERRDGVWSPISEILAPATGGLTVRNRLTVARDGRLHVIYRSNTNIMHASAPLAEARNATAWSEPVRISGFGAAYYVEIASDSRGVLHAFWSEAISDEPGQPPNLVCPNCADLFYRNSHDGGVSWSTPVNLSGTPNDGENRPHVQIDRFDRIHVVWDEGIDWYAGAGQPRAGVYRRSDDGGSNWSDPTYFRLPASGVALAAYEQAARQPAERSLTPEPATGPEVPLDAVQQTTLGLDGNGNPVIVFRGVAVNRIYTQSSPDGGKTWTQAVELPNLRARPSDLDIYHMATDGAGNVHLLMVAFRPFDDVADVFTPPGLWHLTYSNGRWGQPTEIVRNDLYPEYPKLAVLNGNELHAVWFTRSRDDLFDSERARYRVWYSSRPLGAPATTPLPFFTPVPTATPVVEVSVIEATPTPTPLPAGIQQTPPLGERPHWETTGYEAIGLALIPVVLIFGSVIGLRVWMLRRRR